jgi:hypothetical protein
LDGAYTFLHDRIQEAAYSLIPESERAATHLRIGRLLVSSAPLEEIGEEIFEIVNQFNRAAPLITALDERKRVAELNLAAGKRAKTSEAYASAQTYFAASDAFLAENCWDQDYALAFEVALNRAECAFRTGLLTEADERLSMLWERAANQIDRSAVTCLRAALCTTLVRFDRAVGAHRVSRERGRCNSRRHLPARFDHQALDRGRGAHPPGTGEDPPFRPGAASGAGGLRSTVSDYFRFAQCLLNRGELDGVRLLSPGSVALMTASHTGSRYPNEHYGWGLGVRVRTSAAGDEPGSVGSYGWNGGTGTLFVVDPAEQLIVIVFVPTVPRTPGVDEARKSFVNAAYQSIVSPPR